MVEPVDQIAQIRTAINDALASRGEVRLYTKGFRAMANNRFWFTGSNSGSSLPDVCRITDVDPELVELVYFYHRWEELNQLNQLLGSPEKEEKPTDVAEERKKLFQERKQIVTDLFPFSEIVWYAESGATGETCEYARTRKRVEPINTVELRETCKKSRVIAGR